MASSLEIQKLMKSFGPNEVLKGLDLSVPPGAVYGLVGLNGAGKTTTIECALGLLAPDSGEISILGRPPRRIHETRGRIGVALDTPSLHPNLTVREELDHAALFSGKDGRTPEEAEALLGIERFRSVKTRKLSLGNRRRASIALALLGRPELIVLDEPFAGLDASGVEDLIALTLSLHAESGTAILFSSHQLELVERASTHVGIIHEGRIVREGRLEDVLGGGRSHLRIRVDSPEKALAALRGRKAVQEGPGVIAVDPEGSSSAGINADLVRAGVAVFELVQERPSLARLFQEAVKT